MKKLSLTKKSSLIKVAFLDILLLVLTFVLSTAPKAKAQVECQTCFPSGMLHCGLNCSRSC